MEFVRGVPLLDFATSRNLDVPARLKLFREVCEAVQFAHRNLVVHRDLKPSNILVTDEGSARLLDFGISKVISDDGESADLTMAVALMTPEYASPVALVGEPASGMVHQNPAHGLSGDTQKVRPALPRHPPLVNQADIRFVNESGCLEGMVGALMPHAVPGQQTELLVNNRQEPIQGVVVSMAVVQEDAGRFVHVEGHVSSDGACIYQIPNFNPDNR